MSDNLDALKAALAEVGKTKPLVYAATAANLDAVSALCKEHDCPSRSKERTSEKSPKMSTKLMDGGHKDIVLDSGARTVAELLRDNVMIRRLAWKSCTDRLASPQSCSPAKWPTTC